jgi:nicotinate-nucleotide adenylyltransferase
MQDPMRVGIYGGSFDPVHLGHLLVAETGRDRLGLDQVLWIPASQSPLKLDRLPTPDRQRVEMLQLAIGGNEAFRLDERELSRGGVSYTVDTLRELHQEHPEDELFLLIGSDSLHQFDQWRQPEEICRLDLPIVIARGGHPPPDWSVLRRYLAAERFQAALECQIQMPEVEISSSALRQRVAQGRSIRYLVPRAVEMYIAEQKLYRDDALRG